MEETIRNFATQFAYQPTFVNESIFLRKRRSIIVGMGGSHLAGDILTLLDPSLDISIHHDYGLPALHSDASIIINSYSGNTEEAIAAYDQAKKEKLSFAVIISGGALLERAKDDNVPYIQIPDTHIQPRIALGYSLMALLTVLSRDDLLQDAAHLQKLLEPSKFESFGKEIANMTSARVPIIYSSRANQALAYIWKIHFNETGKIPAFYNTFPELNHNELEGFGAGDFKDMFYCIMLTDTADNPHITRRMEVTSKLYEEYGIPVRRIEIGNSNVMEKVFSTICIGAWVAYYRAHNVGRDPNVVAMIEQFKKSLT